MIGKVTAVIRRREGQNGGYGFIRDEHGSERFFHARNLIGGSAAFERLKEGASVTFTPVMQEAGKHNGLRADDVEVAA
jgi:cold shock CspA family protein